MSLFENTKALALAVLMPISVLGLIAYVGRLIMESAPRVEGEGSLAEAQDSVFHSFDLGLDLLAVADGLITIGLFVTVAIGLFAYLRMLSGGY